MADAFNCVGQQLLGAHASPRSAVFFNRLQALLEGFTATPHLLENRTDAVEVVTSTLKLRLSDDSVSSDEEVHIGEQLGEVGRGGGELGL